MMQLHNILLLHSLVLVAAGLAVFFIKPLAPLVMLAIPLLGLAGLALLKQVRKNNRLVKDTLMALYLLTGVLCLMQLNISQFGQNSKNWLLALLSLSCFITVFLFSRNRVKRQEAGSR